MVYAILILFVVFMAFIASWAAAKRWLCFWLGLCGLAMVMALPDRRNGQAGAVLPNDDLPAL